MAGSSPPSLQWSFSNTNSQLLSFKSAQEKGGALAHHNKFLPSHNTFSQRNPCLENQGGGSHYPFHWQQHNEGITFPLATQMVPSPNFPFVGSTDLRNSSNISIGPCQMTIFYNGSVCVYDNVSPDKAQAIMLLAGNGEKNNSSIVHSSAPKVQQPAVPNPSLSFSSSISLVPPPVSALPAAASSPVGLVNPVKQVPVPIPAHVISSDVLKPTTNPAVGSPRPKLIPSAAVPQARKASLARFLEKRKERVISASPYGVIKNTSECSALGPRGSALAPNSASSSPLPAATS